jgi:GNAT superfamily N-acetyltransferase
MRVPAPRTDVSDLGLIDAIAADQVAARITGPEIKVEIHLDPDVSWAIAPLADPFRNVVLGAHFTEATADARIAEIVSRYREAGTSFVWWVSPFDEPSDLGRRLAAAGLVLEGTAPAMAADLIEVPLHEPPPPELEVVPVTDRATLDEFLEVIAADWLEWTGGEHTPVQRRTLDAWRTQIPPKLPDEPVPLRWIGRVNGRVVATSRISIGAGVAGLYAISTMPAFRGKGYGRAMTIAALRAARDIDYRIGVLQASDLGYSVYRRLGFRDLFSYGVYVHPGLAPEPGA